MTDDQIKLEEKDDTSGVLDLSVISNEAIMISNLPLLFADGYPTCLEKFTLVSKCFFLCDIFLFLVHL